jgi:hypothetical protein
MPPVATSENGWVAYNVTTHFVRAQAADFSFWAANADVATIFVDLVTWFDKNIETLSGRVLDDWSWADRLVRDSQTTVSNHASATALDLNSTKHPRGVRHTFSVLHTALIHSRMKYYGGVVRWGGDFSTVVDEMHFEINANTARAATLAAQIRSDNMAHDPLSPADAQLVAEAVLKTLLVPANAQKVTDALVASTVTLSNAAASSMSAAGTARKGGDKLSWSYILQWGGAGLYRLLKLNGLKSPATSPEDAD